MVVVNVRVRVKFASLSLSVCLSHKRSSLPPPKARGKPGGLRNPHYLVPLPPPLPQLPLRSIGALEARYLNRWIDRLDILATNQSLLSVSRLSGRLQLVSVSESVDSWLCLRASSLAWLLRFHRVALPPIRVKESAI